jgi:hypothetical protein
VPSSTRLPKPPSVSASIWTDVGVSALLLVIGAAVAALWPWLQARARGHRFEGIIRRELEEIGPNPSEFSGQPWWLHLRKRFVHQAIFDPAQISENRDFLLTLDPDVVYKVSQLWAAFDKRNGDQFAYFVAALAENRRVKSARLLSAAKAWNAIIDMQPPEWRTSAAAGEPAREELVSAVSEACSALYLQTQRYWRVTRRSVDEDLGGYRKDLESQYFATRERGSVLESRCRIVRRLPTGLSCIGLVTTLVEVVEDGLGGVGDAWPGGDLLAAEADGR